MTVLTVVTAFRVQAGNARQMMQSGAQNSMQMMVMMMIMVMIVIQMVVQRGKIIENTRI